MIISSKKNYLKIGLLLQALLGMSSESYSQITFTKHELSGTFPRTGEIVVEDLDGDGDQDFIVTGFHRDNDPPMGTYLYFNDGEGNFAMVENHGIQNLSYTAVALGDVDSDQDLDMIITGQINAPDLVLSAKMYFNNGDGSFTEAESTPFPATYYSEIEFFDFNGDSNLDVLYTGGIHFSSQLAKIFIGDGNGGFTELEDTGLFPSWYSAIALGDVDLDGDEDLVLSSRSHSSGQGTYVYLRDGNRYYRQSRPINFLVDGEIRLADFDEDGDLDLIVTGNTIFDSRIVSVEYYTNDGNGAFVKEIKEGLVGASRDSNLQVKDFDYDGDLDVFIGGVNQIIDANNFYFNDGNANFTPNNFKFPNNRFGGTAVGDFNGKGYDDVIIFYANITTGNRNMIFLNSEDLNKPPSVSEIQISGKTFVGEELSGTYTYSDPDGDEDRSLLQWFRADNAEGEGKLKIEGATYLKYVLDELDEGKFVWLEITPNDGEKNGETVLSNWVGPIQIALPRIIVTGNNLAIPNGSLEPSREDHTNFGETDYHNGVERIFTVENIGEAELSITEITISGKDPADFSISLPEMNTVPPSGRINFAVGFSPKGVGERSGVINIFSSDEINSPFNFTISGVGLNLPPVFTSADQIEWEENTAGTVIDVDANDGEGGVIDEGLVYSITGGDDAGLFKINAQIGHLSFLQLPDFENTKDLDGDNLYSVEVTANDGGEQNSSSIQLIVISVQNVDEPPVAMCLENLSITLDESGIARIEAEDIDLGSSDDLGIANLSVEPSSWTCKELGPQMVTLTVTDSNGAKAVCTTSVTIVDHQVPIIVEKEPLEKENDPGEGGALVDVPVPEVLDNCDGVIITGKRADGLSLDSFFPIGETIITWTAEDASGNKVEPMLQSVKIFDTEKPVIHPPGSILKNSEGGICGAFVEIVPPIVSDNSNGPIKVIGTRPDHDLEDKFEVGTTYITWIATDAAGNNSIPVIQEVVIYSNIPKDIVVSGPEGPKRIDEEIPIVANFSDDNIAKATWKAMNGDMVVQEHSYLPGDSTIYQTFSGLEAGVYTVILELIDHCGNKATGNSDYVVVYDPNGGFVTGGGWINSPSGAFRNSEVAGKAHFGFNAKYKNGNNDIDEVGGETSFQFKTGNLNFKSVSHEAMSLVVSGGFKATYKGTGTINGEGNFKFMVTVIDSEETVNYSSDLFRIRISEGGTVIYDNNLGVEAEDADPITSIGGGSIVIHKAKAQGKSSQPASDADLQQNEVTEIFTVYPNPMGEKTVVQVVLPRYTTGIMSLFDLNGREVLRVFEGKFEEGDKYEFAVNRNNLMEGVYIIHLETEFNNYRKQLIID